MEYLNYAGLTKYDSKIKNFINEKVDEKLDAPSTIVNGKVIRIDEYGNTVCGEAASQAEIAEATESWLDAHVSGGSTIVVDSSLTVSGAAADAESAGKVAVIQNTQPTENYNRIWVKPEDVEYSIPSYAEHQELESRVDGLDENIDTINDILHGEAYSYEPEYTLVRGKYVDKASEYKSSDSYSMTSDIPLKKGDVITFHTRAGEACALAKSLGDNFYTAIVYDTETTDEEADYRYVAIENMNVVLCEHRYYVINVEDTPALYNVVVYSRREGLYDEFQEVKSALNNSPILKDDAAEDSDLDISDSHGNVLVRFANGHIATKNFDSSEIPSGESQIAIKNSDAAGSDLDVTDSSGNVILRLKNGGIQTKNFDSSKQNVGVCYVAPNGSDSNTGDSESAPFATFQHAIDAGFKRIIAASGEYKNQQIVMNGLHGISIICNSNTTAETLFESHVRRTRAKIDNSIDVTGLTAYSSIYRAPLAVGEDSSFYKVFVSKTLDPVYSGSAYYGRVTTYNAILWEIGEEIAGCTRLVPKLTLSECETTAGTFFFDGSYLYIHPTGNSLTGKTYKRLNLDTNQYGVDVRNCTDIQIQGIDVAFFPYYDLHFAHCENLMVKDCCCTFTSYGSAFEVEGADATFVSCVAAKAGADGFGIATYGNASFYDCSALYCYDDGISHHDAATGVIDGGQWIGCMKGGVTPSFGSNVSVKNVVCHGNVYGIYITQSGTRVTNAVLTMQNCLAFDNVTQDIRVTGYDVISHGCAYRTKQIDDGASFAEYGNTVIE